MLTDLTNKRVLYLSLIDDRKGKPRKGQYPQPWFSLMLAGTKTDEYRKPTKYIMDRLIGKEYDYVFFRNGYNPKSPWFLCEYKGWDRAWRPEQVCFPDCHMIEVEEGDYIIHLGPVIESGNLKLAPPPNLS